MSTFNKGDRYEVTETNSNSSGIVAGTLVTVFEDSNSGWRVAVTPDRWNSSNSHLAGRGYVYVNVSDLASVSAPAFAPGDHVRTGTGEGTIDRAYTTLTGDAAHFINFTSGGNAGSCLWARNVDITLLRKANNVNTLSAAELRKEANSYLWGTAEYNALHALADKLDPPKPTVAVRHSLGNNIVVGFEKREDASAVSHFLYKADNLIEGLYPDEPRKREVVRAFVDAWHSRTGK